MPRRAAYLKTLLSKGAPRDSSVQCQSCGRKDWKWRCKDCIGGRLLCSGCCKTEHQLLLFHRVEMWNGRYFAAGALWQVGVKIYLGHQGLQCPQVRIGMQSADEDNGEYRVS